MSAHSPFSKDIMPKSNKCACGVRLKVHARKSRRHQLPHTGLKTDRLGYPRPRAGARTKKDVLPKDDDLD